MKKILLIDDSVMTLRLGKKLLEPLGADVSIAESAEVALDMVKQEGRDFDLVIIDYNLGKDSVNGIELGVEIRDMESYAETPLIMLSGEEDLELKTWCSDAGFDGCYRKGLEESGDFLSCITGILSGEDKQRAA